MKGSDIMALEKLYTVAEVADYLRVSKNTIYLYISKGKLKSVSVEGVVRIRESDLQAFVESKG